MTIDWTKPIEAVRKSDGRVVPVTLGPERPKGLADRYTVECPDENETNTAWYEDGRDWCTRGLWFVRNRTDQPAASEPAPDTLTLRDQFAMAAPITESIAIEIADLYGCDLSDAGNRASLFETWVKLRYEFADAMILERNRERDADQRRRPLLPGRGCRTRGCRDARCAR